MERRSNSRRAEADWEDDLRDSESGLVVFRQFRPHGRQSDVPATVLRVSSGTDSNGHSAIRDDCQLGSRRGQVDGPDQFRALGKCRRSARSPPATSLALWRLSSASSHRPSGKFVVPSSFFCRGDSRLLLLSRLEHPLRYPNPSSVPSCTPLPTRPTNTPVNPLRPSERLRLTVTNQKPGPRDESDTSARTSSPVQK